MHISRASSHNHGWFVKYICTAASSTEFQDDQSIAKTDTACEYFLQDSLFNFDLRQYLAERVKIIDVVSSGTKGSRTSFPHVPVYNCVSGAFKSVSWNEIVRTLDKAMTDYPFYESLTNPRFGMTDSRVKCTLNYLVHALPAALGDIVVRASGGIPR